MSAGLIEPPDEWFEHAHEYLEEADDEFELAAAIDAELEGVSTHATEEALGGMEGLLADEESPEAEAQDEASLGWPAESLESGVGGIFGWVRRANERIVLRADIRAGQKSEKELTNKVFFLRHPSREGTRILKGEGELIREWREIHARLVLPELLTGPYIGPMHSPAGTPAGPELRKGVSASAKLSPLAITLRGLRKAPHKQPAPIAAIVVHNTSRGPANRSREAGYAKPAIHYALNYYIGGDGGFPHYVVDFNGTIYATCDEQLMAHHAGWVHKGGAKLFTSGWTKPEWWSRVWSKQGIATPLNLLPKGAWSPNSRTIGIELLNLPDFSYSVEQYQALARLVVDIQRRNPDLRITSAPSKALLGHEDFAPVMAEGGRAERRGGWDPGAHREDPYFDWQRLWSVIQAVSPGFGGRQASVPPPVPSPEVAGEELEEGLVGGPFDDQGAGELFVAELEDDAVPELAREDQFDASVPPPAPSPEVAGEELEEGLVGGPFDDQGAGELFVAELEDDAVPELAREDQLDTFAERLEPDSALLSEAPSSMWGKMIEQAILAAQIGAGSLDENTLTNTIFFRRYPGLRDTKLQPGQEALMEEWRVIRQTLVRPALERARGGGAPTGPAHATTPNVPLGTLTHLAPGWGPFSYPFTPYDLEWTARFLHGEAGGRDDAENRAVLWTMFNRYAFFRNEVPSWGRFGDFIRLYSTPLQPYLRSVGAAKRHWKKCDAQYSNCDFVPMAEPYGYYPGTRIPRGQLRQFLKLQNRPWTGLSQSARDLAQRALQGAIPNPIGAASEFGDTAVYFRDLHNKKPTRQEWFDFTKAYAARKKWIWPSDSQPYDQFKRNVIFINGRARNLREGARVVPT